MIPRLLILGGTTEAAALCRAVAAAGLRATVSLAGRVSAPAPLPLPYRVGGFGGAKGLAAYLRAEGITHLIDATHPFAAQISRNAAEASAATGVPLLALTRPVWQRQSGDDWTCVPDIAAAVVALAGPPARIMLAIGRQHLAGFAANPQHFYLLRLVDPPAAPLPFPSHHVLISRGPFTADGDMALLRAHRIDLVVSKNSGGGGARAKITAARQLGLPVLMIARPALPQRSEVTNVADALGWLAHSGVDLGV